MKFRGATDDWGTPLQRQLVQILFPLRTGYIMKDFSPSSAKIQPLIEHLERELQEGEPKFYHPILVYCGFSGVENTEQGMIHLVERVVTIVSGTKDGQLSIDELINELATRNGVIAGREDPPALVRQGIFSLVGWMTRLLKISEDVSHTHFSISEPRNLRLASPRKTLDEAVNDLGELIVSFGTFVPRPQHNLTLIKAVERENPNSVDLNIAYMNVSALTRVGKIRIEWSDLLSAHLNFDQYSKNLTIFRFPTFCALNCTAGGDSTVFDW
ncbi:MAG: hypothetical protein Q9202_005397 [Teloschistes flavicans]